MKLVSTLFILLFCSTFATYGQSLPTEPSFAQSDNAQIAYWVMGEGEPLLLVHGFLGRATSWSNYLDALSKEHQLILVELRGHGFSTNDKDYYSNHDAAGDLVAVIDDIGLKTVDAVGFSAGSMALLNMAIMYPERVNSIAVIGGFIKTTEKASALFQSFHPDKVNPAVHEIVIESHERGEIQAMALLGHLQDFAQNTEPEFTLDQLASINARTLVITGDRDLVIPIEQSIELYRNIPDAYLMVSPNTGHSISPADEKGREFLLSTLLAFFSNSWQCPAFCDQ